MKSPETRRFSIQCLAKKGKCSAPLWSFNFLSKLMRGANCVRFCPHPFCREVNTTYLVSYTCHSPVVATKLCLTYMYFICDHMQHNCYLSLEIKIFFVLLSEI